MKSAFRPPCKTSWRIVSTDCRWRRSAFCRPLQSSVSSFRLRLLQAVAEVGDEDLRLYLTHLQMAEFLYETNLFPELEYSFKHAITSEVA